MTCTPGFTGSCWYSLYTVLLHAGWRSLWLSFFFKFDFLALSLSAFPCFVSFSWISCLLVSFSVVYTVEVSLLSPLSHLCSDFVIISILSSPQGHCLLTQFCIYIVFNLSLFWLPIVIPCPVFFICLSQFPHCIQTVLSLHWLIVFTLTQAVSTSRDHHGYFNSGWSHRHLIVAQHRIFVYSTSGSSLGKTVWLIT